MKVGNNQLSKYDGSDPIGHDYLFAGTLKAWGQCDGAGAAHRSGTFNVGSITDQGTTGKDFNLINAFDNLALTARGATDISTWGNNQGFIYDNGGGSSPSVIRASYYSGVSNIDGAQSFTAIGDLAA